MLSPQTAVRELAQAREDGVWLALRRPFFLMFVAGCSVSLVSSGRLTLRLIVDGVISYSFVLLFMMVSLALVWWKRHQQLSFARANDLFFVSLGPWLIWLAIFASMAAWTSPTATSVWTGPTRIWFWLASLAPVMAWSGYIDFVFFRDVLGLGPARAVSALLLQRAVCWGSAIVYLLAYAGWPLVAQRMGL